VLPVLPTIRTAEHPDAANDMDGARMGDKGIPGLRLAAVSARDLSRADAAIARFRHPVRPLAELAGVADVIVECRPAAVSEPF
jgi:hypothetical protein